MLVRLHAAEYLENLLEGGQSTFTFNDYMVAQGASFEAAKSAINRLKKKGAVASPYPNFFVIVRPEERTLGCPEPQNFIPQLMSHLGRPYYVGLLSAAEHYGAAHQRPQEFQVVTDLPHRVLKCGNVRVRFIVRTNLKFIPTVTTNSRSSSYPVSTPEATLFDLLEYPRHAAGLDNIANIIIEIGERISGEKLLLASRLFHTATLQRLGYMLETLGYSNVATPLKEEVERLTPQYAGLDRSTKISGAKRDKRWRLAINYKLNPDV